MISLKRRAGMCRILLLSIIFCTSLSQAEAAEVCDAYRFVNSKDFAVAVVKSGPAVKAYFYRAIENCQGEECRGRAYVISGDRVLVTKQGSDWVCAYFKGRDRDTVGWLRKAALEISAAKNNPAPSDWLGTWEVGRDSIDISPGGIAPKINIKGLALGAGDAPNIGQFAGESAPNKNTIIVKDESCQVRMTMIDDVLVVSDNGECGGWGVDFDGLYDRKD